MMSRIELYDRVDEMLGDDSRVALFAIRRMLDEELPWLELRAVRRARADGKSWARIGRALGRSRQAVQQRYADLDHQWSMIPQKQALMADRIDRATRVAVNDAVRRREQAAREAAGEGVVPW